MNPPRHMKLAYRNENQKVVIVFAIFLLVTGLILTLTYVIASKATETTLKSDTSFQFERLKAALNGVLDKHIYLPKILAKNTMVVDFLATADSASMADVLQINKYLEKVNTLSNTLDVYLMRPNGNTVAASNWEKPRSFVGKNFAFRPYFTQAMENRLGRYYALGTTSQERGYYFASAVHDNADIVGVVVVKIPIDEVETSWNNPAVDFMVTDADGVIFLSSRKDWRLRSIGPLSEEVVTDLVQSQKYGTQRILPLKFSFDKREDHTLLTDSKNAYLMVDEFQKASDWHVYVLMNLKAVRARVAWTMFTALLATLLASTLIFIFYQRQLTRRRYAIREREVLEQKVAERTRELKLAQEELIHAGKMAALGQLSASINHELNNPLAAIRAYAENAVQFMDHNRPDMVKKNLQKVSELTERMATITHQLKSFARKSEGKIETVSLNHALDSSLSILRPQIKKYDVLVDNRLGKEDVWVQADHLWLEQILINLLKNAIDATSEKETRELIIRSQQESEQVVLSIIDNGSGFGADQLEHVFEPFFTTKKSGKGLGLGLSISYRLARDMQGNLSAENHADGGAIFHLTLPSGTKTPVKRDP